MARFHLVVALAAGALSACSTAPRPPASTALLTRSCNLGLLRHGSDPRRPYRVLGEVQADDDVVSTREKSLEAAACKLGAQAVIEVREVLEPNGNNFGRAESDKAWPGMNEGRPATAGLAVVFTDGGGAPRPPKPEPARYSFPD